MFTRGSGILLHVSSLPSVFGIGDLGPGAYRFVDLLARAKQTYWQILPLNPTDGVFYHSPYSSCSAYAGNELLISPELLVEDGLLDPRDLKTAPQFSHTEVNYEAVEQFKLPLLALAYNRFNKSPQQIKEFDDFCRGNQDWLDDFAMFKVFKSTFHNAVFPDWPDEFRDRAKDSLAAARKEHEAELRQVKFRQWLFFKQWIALRNYCHEHSIKIIGDMPIYVNDDSVEVWSSPEYYDLDKSKFPVNVAGVPPDYFSETGQRWGNPVYRWEQLKADGYRWWIRRIRHNLKLFDILRIDHFRGLVQYWEIPAKEKTAVKGKWVKVPSEDFFDTLLREFPSLPIIAEDLGIITPDVTELMEKYGFPGMKVLLFAFDEDLKKHPYLPENYTKNCVVYTGTHDNNTIRGWYLHDASKKAKENLSLYFKGAFRENNLNWVLIKSALASKATIAIIPVQDVLGFGQEARMNKPSTVNGNWVWRVESKQLQEFPSNMLEKLTSESFR